MTIPDPQGLTWEQWANTVAGFNPTFGQYVDPSMSWDDYAQALHYLIPQAPQSGFFETWQDWATALRQVV